MTFNTNRSVGPYTSGRRLGASSSPSDRDHRTGSATHTDCCDNPTIAAIRLPATPSAASNTTWAVDGHDAPWSGPQPALQLAAFLMVNTNGSSVDISTPKRPDTQSAHSKN